MRSGPHQKCGEAFCDLVRDVAYVNVRSCQEAIVSVIHTQDKNRVLEPFARVIRDLPNTFQTQRSRRKSHVADVETGPRLSPRSNQPVRRAWLFFRYRSPLNPTRRSEFYPRAIVLDYSKFRASQQFVKTLAAWCLAHVLSCFLHIYNVASRVCLDINRRKNANRNRQLEADCWLSHGATLQCG